MSRLRSFLVFATVVAATGCPGGSGADGSLTGCNEDVDCSLRESCINGYCQDPGVFGDGDGDGDGDIGRPDGGVSVPDSGSVQLVDGGGPNDGGVPNNDSGSSDGGGPNDAGPGAGDAGSVDGGGDGDGDLDVDMDGLTALEEAEWGTNPLDPDSDDDTLLDGEEVTLGSNPLAADSDDDGVGDAEELILGTGITDPDSDDDGLNDGAEVAAGTLPLVADTDDDGLSDGDEANVYGTSPVDNDSDDDSLLDGAEVALMTNPLDSDSDDDGVDDGTEVLLTLDPLDADTDDDGLTDGEEVALGTNPKVEDTDEDGWSDGFETPDPGNPPDADGDSVIDALDPDPPRSNEGVLAWYRFNEGSGALLNDVSGAGVPMDLDLGFSPGGEYTWVDSGLHMDRAHALSSGPADKVTNACKASNALTVEVWLTTHDPVPEGPDRLVTISEGTDTSNFTVGVGHNLDPAPEFDLRIGDNAGSRVFADSADDTLLVGQMIHIVMRVDANAGGEIELFSNLERLVLTSGAGGALTPVDGFAGWHDSPFAIGDEPNTASTSLARATDSTFHMVAVYCRALSDDEIEQNFAAGPNSL